MRVARVSLFIQDWPVRDPVAAIGILHGYGEHSGRYAHAAAAWNARGLAVFGLDFRGHGRSAGRRAHVARFSDYHEDVDALLEHMRGRTPKIPAFLFAHSMGGLVATDWMLARGVQPTRDLAGLAMSSPLFGVALAVPPIKALLGHAMSRVFPALAMKSGVKGSIAARDPNAVIVYDDDPLMNRVATARWFVEALRAMDRGILNASRLEVPLILLYAGMDYVVSRQKTETFARGLTMKDRTVECIADAYHELVNEPPDERRFIFSRYADWFLAHVEQAGAQDKSTRTL